jgi:hypothetical protein
MSRLFELKSHTYEGDVATIIDLSKVCWLQIEKKPGQHYPHLIVRFVDGHEWHDLMIDPSAYHLVEAYRAYLGSQDSDETPAIVSGSGHVNEMSHAITASPKIVHPLNRSAISAVHN